MNHSDHQFIFGNRMFRYALLAVVFGAIVALWIGSGRVSAISGFPETQQTLPPPPPTSQPTPRPTPTPRPGRSDSDDNKESAPTATSTQVATIAPPAASLVFTGTIDAPVLNVRRGPGTSFPVVGRLDNGAVITILARNSEGTWLNICCLPDSQEQGWVSAAFVKPAYSAEQASALPVLNSSGVLATAPVAAPVAATNTLTGAVSAISLNVRAEPSTTGELLGRLRSGAVVNLLGRNAAGDWWLVCCIPDVTGNGWVAAEFVTPGATSGQIAALPVTTGLATPVVAVRAAATVTATTAVTTTSAPEAAVALTTTLVLSSDQQPVAAVQGDEIVMSFALTNTGDVTATLVELSFELAPGLSFVSASANDGGETTQEEAELGAEVVVIGWPELAGGATTTARITVAIDSELENGTVIDGYVVAQADNAESTFVPLLVAMPPAEPPDFQ